jgi:hypothetical protein
MNPEQRAHLQTFHDLLTQSVNSLRSATSQTALASRASELQQIWADVDEDFAELLGEVRTQAYTMPYLQSRKVADTIIVHLEQTLAQVKNDLN